MGDNELLLHTLNDPSLIHSLQAKSSFPIPTNSKTERSSSLNLIGLSRGPGNMNLNGVSRGLLKGQLLHGVVGIANQ